MCCAGIRDSGARNEVIGGQGRTRWLPDSTQSYVELVPRGQKTPSPVSAASFVSVRGF